MTKKEKLLRNIQDVKNEIQQTREDMENFEIDPDDYIDEYEEMLDEMYPVCIAGIYFDASRVIQELDPTLYRCGLNDYVDSLEKKDDPEYQKLEQNLEVLETDLEVLEIELAELELRESDE